MCHGNASALSVIQLCSFSLLGASLNGWRCAKYAPSATCPFYSWHNYTATRITDLHRDPCLVQRTLYSLHTTPYGSPNQEATDLMSPFCPLGAAPRILASSGLKCPPLMTWICGLYSNQSTFRCLPWAEETQATREDSSSVWPWMSTLQYLTVQLFFLITFYWKLHCSGARDNNCRWVLKGEDVMEAKLILEDKMVSHYAKWLP